MNKLLNSSSAELEADVKMTDIPEIYCTEAVTVEQDSVSVEHLGRLVMLSSING